MSTSHAPKTSIFLLGLWYLLRGGSVLLFCGVSFGLLLRRLLVRGFWRFVTHDLHVIIRDLRSQYGQLIQVDFRDELDRAPALQATGEDRFFRVTTDTGNFRLLGLHHRPKHPRDKLFRAEPMRFRTGLPTRRRFQDQLENAFSYFLDRGFAIQNLAAIDIHIIRHLPV